MTGFELYLIMKIGAIANMIIMLGTLCLVGCGGYLLFGSIEVGWENMNIPRTKNYIVLGFSLLFLGNLIPTTKEIVAIIVVPSIVNNEKVKSIPTKLLDIVDKELSEIINNLDKTKEN